MMPKFRAFDGERWYVPDYIDDNGWPCRYESRPGSSVESSLVSHHDHPLVQCTGFKDAEGGELYSDDVVEVRQKGMTFEQSQASGHTMIAAIEWVEAGFYIRWASGYAMPLTEEMARSMRRLGSIHEHPHLLSAPERAST